jgi:peptidoglycan/LPS O-acetylase OafA/YrhL
MAELRKTIATAGRENNFDLLRLVAAGFVLLSHAIAITNGNLGADPLFIVTNGQSLLGFVGVFVFFTISGYLITESFVRSGSPSGYLVKRALRIAPGLIVCTLVSALLIGPLITSLPLAAYFHTSGLYGFMANNLILHVGYNGLPGVDYVANANGEIVNGSLWTLPAEVLMYLMVFGLGLLRLLRPPVAIALVLAGMAAILFKTHEHGLIGNSAWLLGYFAMGMFLYLVRSSRPLRPTVAFVAGLMLAISIPLGCFTLFFPICGGYLVIFIAYWRALPVVHAARFGDLSYGIYIYGWPIEGAVAHFAHGVPWEGVLAISALICVPVAFLSWHLVEKPAMALKPRYGRPLPELPLQVAAPSGGAEVQSGRISP